MTFPSLTARVETVMSLLHLTVSDSEVQLEKMIFFPTTTQFLI